MAEEKPTPKHEIDGDIMSRDDLRTLRYVLHNVRGASPSSMQLPTLAEELIEEV